MCIRSFLTLLIILLFYTLSTGQEQSKIVSKNEFDHPLVHILSLNPIRGSVDEISIFSEWSDLENRGIGFSIGYIHPNTITDDGIIDIIRYEDDIDIRLNSRGAALRIFHKWYLKNQKYINLVGQTRYYTVNDFEFTAGNNLSDDAVELNIDRSSLLAGIQLHYGKVFGNKTRGFHQELYLGLGVNFAFNISTEYNSYSSRGIQSTDVPPNLRLDSDDEIYPIPTVHIGYRLGLQARRN